MASRHGDRRDAVDGTGSEYLRAAIDDHHRIALSAIQPEGTTASTLHFLRAAMA